VLGIKVLLRACPSLDLDHALLFALPSHQLPNDNSQGPSWQVANKKLDTLSLFHLSKWPGKQGATGRRTKPEGNTSKKS
jgi:hypothetical protein